MINPFLAGDRIYLRPLEMEDVERCQRWFKDPQVRQFLATVYPLSRQAERSFLERIVGSPIAPGSDIILAIALQADDQHIGNVGLHHINTVDRNAELGIAIGEKNMWQKGFGTEACRLLVEYGFTALNLHRIYLRVNSDNPRAQAAYRKIGFQQEGVWREAIFRQGRYQDLVLMGLLRKEYPGRNKGGKRREPEERSSRRSAAS